MRRYLTQTIDALLKGAARLIDPTGGQPDPEPVPPPQRPAVAIAAHWRAVGRYMYRAIGRHQPGAKLPKS